MADLSTGVGFFAGRWQFTHTQVWRPREFKAQRGKYDRFVEPQRKWADVILTQPFQENEIHDLADSLSVLVDRAALRPAGLKAAFRADLTGRLMHPH